MLRPAGPAWPGLAGRDTFSLHLGGRYHPPVTAWAALVFVLRQGLNLATPADL